MGKRRRLALPDSSDDDDDDDNAAAEAPKRAAPDSSRRHSAADDQADPELVGEWEDDNVLVEMGMNGGEEETQTLRHRVREPGHPAEEEEQEERDGELEEKAEADEEEDDEDHPDAVPLGEPVDVAGEGKQYAAFEYEGNTYKLEDTAMFMPDERNQKPYVGIIKEITEIDGSLSVTAQWFYRPEEAQKEAGGDPRKLFYSFHLDDVAAESVMHTCVVHFIPQHKQVPSKKEHPGFIVQEVYDHKEEKFYKVTDTDYADENQQDIDLLVMKTMDRIGELPDRDPEDISGDKSDSLPSQGLGKRPRKPKDIPRDAPAGRSEQLIKEDTAGNDNLKKKSVTGNQIRDQWLDRFVDSILALPHSRNKSSVLCKRLMNKELDPLVLLTMTPAELKAGLTPAEIGYEFEESRQLQTCEARCRRCKEKNVGIRDIMNANHGNRYQVECMSCGYGWSASIDEIVER